MTDRDLRAAIGRLHVLVAGDVMLDEYWFGEVRRISPEAPVPIVRVANCEERPGGAANVARNIVSLGAQATLVSIVGADDAGTRLGRVLDDAGVARELCVDPALRTTVKLRVIGQHQQMLRIDFEETPSADALAQLQARYEQALAAADIVVLSDYGKGALADVAALIAAARRLGKPVLVDPKGRDFTRYAGATSITPNRAEMAEAAGPWEDMAGLDRKAQDLRAGLGLEALVVTMSKQGMRLYADKAVIHQPARAREVFDVSGAGDTVIAALAITRGCGASWEEAVAFANAAGGVAVGKLGTSTVSHDEVAAFLAAGPA